MVVLYVQIHGFPDYDVLDVQATADDLVVELHFWFRRP